jgi:hypothetical protein
MALVAVTLKTYVFPVVSPVMVHDVVVLVHESPPGDAVAVYKVIADPPFEAGALQVTEAEVTEATVAFTFVGAPGGAAGTMALDTPKDPVPYVLVAVTSKV